MCDALRCTVIGALSSRSRIHVDFGRVLLTKRAFDRAVASEQDHAETNI
jgi:hypothetical protein